MSDSLKALSRDFLSSDKFYSKYGAPGDRIRTTPNTESLVAAIARELVEFEHMLTTQRERRLGTASPELDSLQEQVETLQEELADALTDLDEANARIAQLEGQTADVPLDISLEG